MIMPELAEKIIIEVKTLLDEEIIVADTNGTIIASTDKKRIGTFHEGALISTTRKEKLTITEEDLHRLSGVKAGINLPVFFQREVIGVIGITGHPDKVSPFGEILRKITELIISENYYSEELDLEARALEAFVFDWIQSREWDTSFQDRAQLLKVDLSFPRQAAIAELDIHSPVPRDIWHSIFKWKNSRNNDIIVRRGNDRLVMLLETTAAESRASVAERLGYFHQFLKDKLRVSVSIGVGQQVSPYSLNKSYKQAERAIKAIKKDTQDSCHLRNVMKTAAAPRVLLQSISGTEYREMKDADRCCGSAGIYNIVESEMSMKILDYKMEQAKETHAATIATANPGCLLQMKLGVEREGLAAEVRAVHIVDLLLEAARQ